MPTETDKAYFAGLLDGEGHIGITLAKPRGARSDWRTHAVIVTLSNTHTDTLTWAQTLWPTAKGTLVIRTQSKQRVPIGNLRWSSAAAGVVLRDVVPYLRIKVSQATIALQFIHEMGERAFRAQVISEEEWYRREEMRLAIRQLNRADPTLIPEPYPIVDRTRGCAFCGQVFERAPGSRQMYCSVACESKERWQRQKAKQTRPGDCSGSTLT